MQCSIDQSNKFVSNLFKQIFSLKFILFNFQEDDDLARGLEEQKRRREEILKRKEQRRQMAAAERREGTQKSARGQGSDTRDFNCMD